MTYWKKVIEREVNSRDVVGTIREIRKKDRALVSLFLVLCSLIRKITLNKSIPTEQKAVGRRK